MNTQNDKATPRPWIAMGFPQTQGWTIAHQASDGRTSHIAELPPYIGNQTNAALIVRSVNERDALLAVAEAAEKAVQLLGNNLAGMHQLDKALSGLREGKE